MTIITGNWRSIKSKEMGDGKAVYLNKCTKIIKPVIWLLGWK